MGTVASQPGTSVPSSNGKKPRAFVGASVAPSAPQVAPSVAPPPPPSSAPVSIVPPTRPDPNAAVGHRPPRASSPILDGARTLPLAQPAPTIPPPPASERPSAKLAADRTPKPLAVVTGGSFRPSQHPISASSIPSAPASFRPVAPAPASVRPMMPPAPPSVRPIAPPPAVMPVQTFAPPLPPAPEGMYIQPVIAQSIVAVPPPLTPMPPPPATESTDGLSFHVYTPNDTSARPAMRQTGSIVIPMAKPSIAARVVGVAVAFCVVSLSAAAIAIGTSDDAPKAAAAKPAMTISAPEPPPPAAPVVEPTPDPTPAPVVAPTPEPAPKAITKPKKKAKVLAPPPNPYDSAPKPTARK